MSRKVRKLPRRSDRAPTATAKAAPRAADAPTRPALVVSFADLSRLAAVHRSSVTRACAPGGPLHAAVVAPGRLDLGAQAVATWLAEHAGTSPVLVDEAGAVSLSDVARKRGVDVSDVQRAIQPSGELREAFLAEHHLSAVTFALLSGAPLATVLESTRAELAPAVTVAGGIDLSDPAALAFLAARPFRRLPSGDLDPEGVPAGMLAPACRGSEVDFDSPFARAFLARARGRVPSDDLAELAAGDT